MVGFIGDIHGDLEPIRWALDELADADEIIALGDVVHGPDDAACIALLRARGVTVLVNAGIPSLCVVALQERPPRS